MFSEFEFKSPQYRSRHDECHENKRPRLASNRIPITETSFILILFENKKVYDWVYLEPDGNVVSSGIVDGRNKSELDIMEKSLAQANNTHCDVVMHENPNVTNINIICMKDIARFHYGFSPNNTMTPSELYAFFFNGKKEANILEILKENFFEGRFRGWW